MKKLIVGVNKLLTIKGEHVMRTNATTLFTQINREQTETNKQTYHRKMQRKFSILLLFKGFLTTPRKIKERKQPSQETKQPTNQSSNIITTTSTNSNNIGIQQSNQIKTAAVVFVYKYFIL